MIKRLQEVHRMSSGNAKALMLDIIRDGLSLLQRRSWKRNPCRGLPPPGHPEVRWCSKHMHALDDWWRIGDDEIVIDYYPSIPRPKRRPIATRARGRTLPQSARIQAVDLGFTFGDIARFLDFDPEIEILRSDFAFSELPQEVKEEARTLPRKDLEQWDPCTADEIHIYTDGSHFEGKAAWAFVVVALLEGQEFLVGYHAARVAETEEVTHVLDTPSSSFGAEQQGLLWSAWRVLRLLHTLGHKAVVVF